MNEKLIHFATKVIEFYTEGEVTIIPGILPGKHTIVPRDSIVYFSRNDGLVPVDGRECFPVERLGDFMRGKWPLTKNT